MNLERAEQYRFRESLRSGNIGFFSRYFEMSFQEFEQKYSDATPQNIIGQDGKTWIILDIIEQDGTVRIQTIAENNFLKLFKKYYDSKKNRKIPIGCSNELLLKLIVNQALVAPEIVGYYSAQTTTVCCKLSNNYFSISGKPDFPPPKI